ncbi:MFS transporter [Pseudonocardia phyllosphaerae]|uniref:MFS transporter n=1 Tax=Pseudonocardia phyllosphaerae TaxID=3390502 RepID=UPI00397BFF27
MPRNVLEDAPLSGFHKRLALFSSGGPFLDGYVLSIIGVALVQASPALGLSASEEGLVGAAALVGIFLGAFAGGWLTDRFGRHLLFTIDLVAIIAFSVAQFFVTDAVWLIVLRLLVGMAVGADYPIATSLLAEFSPRRHRGPLLGAFVTMWFVGAAAAYLVGELLLAYDDGWRWMLASAALPGLLIVVCRIGTPESPRWLLSKGRVDEAAAVMRKVFGPDAGVEDIEPDPEGTVGLRRLVRSGYAGRLVFVTLFWTCSVVPLFAIYAFGPKILGALNLSDGADTVGSAVITVMFLVGCAVSLLLVNRMGRRSLLLHSFLWAGLAMLGLGLFPEAPVGVVMGLFVAYAVFIGGSQILQWIYPNELFPTEIRGSAVGLCSSLSRIGAAVGTYLVPLSLSGLGIGTTMVIGAAVTLGGLAVSWFMAPETAHLGLSEAAALDTPSAAPAATPVRR